jgi:hypothetical protein
MEEIYAKELTVDHFEDLGIYARIVIRCEKMVCKGVG